MSKRLLIFSHGKVSFRCRKSEWQEDSIEESAEMDMRSSSAVVSHKYRDYYEGPQSDWVHHLRTFSKRKLTYESDVLAAFAGISKMYARSMGTELVYGIPVLMFDKVILWDGFEVYRRRPGFPSWSWAGWIGSIDLNLTHSQALEKWTLRYTWIVWHLLHDDGTLKPLSTRAKSIENLTADEIRMDGSTIANQNTSDLISPITDSSSVSKGAEAVSVSTTNGLLYFYSASGPFLLSSRNSSIEALTGRKSWAFYDSNDIRCGSFNPNEDWNTRTDAIYEVILLSGCPIIENDYKIAIKEAGRDHGYTPTIDPSSCLFVNGNGPDPESVSDSVTAGAVDFFKEALRREWQGFNVMVVEQRGGVAQRVGIGTLYKAAILHAFAPGVQWKAFVLG